MISLDVFLPCSQIKSPYDQCFFQCFALKHLNLYSYTVKSKPLLKYSLYYFCYCRVKQAIIKKEEVVNQLKEQYQAALKRADHLEGLLQQQRKKILAKWPTSTPSPLTTTFITQKDGQTFIIKKLSTTCIWYSSTLVLYKKACESIEAGIEKFVKMHLLH